MEMLIENKIKDICFDLGGYRNLSVRRLYKGNSMAVNYCVESGSKPCYFAKVYPTKSNLRVRALKYLNQFSEAIIPPLYDYEINDGIHLMIMKWIDCSEISANVYNAQKCAALLRQLHSIPIPQGYPSIDINEETKKQISFIVQNEISFSQRDSIVSYLRTTSLRNKTLSFVHMDFHIKNIISENENIYFIDYENLSISHPWSDLVYACFFHDRSENYFWKKLIDEYFEGIIPQNFWSEMKVLIYIQLLRMIICEYQKNNFTEISRLNNSILTGFPIETDVPRWILE